MGLGGMETDLEGLPPLCFRGLSAPTFHDWAGGSERWLLPCSSPDCTVLVFQEIRTLALIVSLPPPSLSLGTRLGAGGGEAV